MKKLTALFLAIAFTVNLSSCIHMHGDLSLSFSESDHYYYMNAHFDKSKTKDVDQYMNSQLGKRSNMSFGNTKIDGMLTLDDETNFYLKKSSGVLAIKLDKDKNSEEACQRIRLMCEGLKSVLVK